MADLLDKWDVFRSRLFRESCVFHRGNYVKDLGRLGRELHKIIIVDNSPASYIFHPENAVRKYQVLFEKLFMLRHVLVFTSHIFVFVNQFGYMTQNGLNVIVKSSFSFSTFGFDFETNDFDPLIQQRVISIFNFQ